MLPNQSKKAYDFLSLYSITEKISCKARLDFYSGTTFLNVTKDSKKSRCIVPSNKEFAAVM
jgi:hypothetical protein